MEGAKVLYKVRTEGPEVFGVSLEEDLEAGESLTGQPAVRILRREDDGSITDATNEFGVDAVQYATVLLPSGATHRSITFTADAPAQTADQPERVHQIEAKAHTNTGRSFVRGSANGHLPKLIVRAV